MMYSRILALVLIVAATLWIGSGVFGRTEAPAEAHGEAAAAPVAQPLFQVAVIPAAVEEHSRVLSLSGRTEADNRASAIARTAGSIVELNVEARRPRQGRRRHRHASPTRRARRRSQRRRRWSIRSGSTSRRR